jgi:hypothetical protein
MAGYANRVIMLDFPELSEEGDKVHVIIRNPKTVPLQDLMADDVPNLPDGTLDSRGQFMAGMKIIANLVQAWHVYDATSMDGDQPPLPLPATPELAAKLPMEIQNAIAEEIKKVRSAGA